MHIELDEQKSCLTTTWQQHPSSEELRRHLLIIADLIQQHRCRYWLSDAHSLYYVELADQNWLVREVLSRIHPTVKKIARILTKESLLLLDMQHIFDKIATQPQLAASGMQIETFLDKESAIVWLSQHEEEA